ncbi:hypothetical protein B0H16DRAFT_1477068 [Mycena metata]|uniref:Uncharacterized protein n=1 Tax=Mycena metata TaxID=1033252 RepID=A0AAD7H9Y9_9AGAR|nr:hypothetical protein B0H16DRAFT_1477068 [Mycena metata]
MYEWKIRSSPAEMEDRRRETVRAGRTSRERPISNLPPRCRKYQTRDKRRQKCPHQKSEYKVPSPRFASGGNHKKKKGAEIHGRPKHSRVPEMRAKEKGEVALDIKVARAWGAVLFPALVRFPQRLGVNIRHNNELANLIRAVRGVLASSHSFHMIQAEKDYIPTTLLQSVGCSKERGLGLAEYAADLNFRRMRTPVDAGTRRGSKPKRRGGVGVEGKRQDLEWR